MLAAELSAHQLARLDMETKPSRPHRVLTPSWLLPAIAAAVILVIIQLASGVQVNGQRRTDL